MPSKINLVQAKTIFTKSGLPGSDWVINPYNGCTFGCMYCYAAQIARWKHPDEVWGSYLDVKLNAPLLLKQELKKLERKYQKKDFGTVFFSSVTDPYVGLETKYQLTRQCLTVLSEFGYTGKVAIQTKSPLVTRDLDILKTLKDTEVGCTVTSLDDRVSRFLEVQAPSISSRLHALQVLHENGIRTYAFVGPLLPYVTKSPKKIRKLLDKLEEVGVSEVWFEHINLSPKIKQRLFTFLKKEAPELIGDFERGDTSEYRDLLNTVIHRAMKGRKLKMGLGKVIYHRELPKKN